MLLSLLLVSCGQGPDRPHGVPGAGPDAGDADTDTAPDAGDGWIPPQTFAVHEVEPDHGPPPGGNEVSIRGTGFGGPFYAGFLTVSFGGRLVDPVDLEVISPRRIRVLRVPPGEVGPADVEVSMDDPEDVLRTAILPGGYRYDSFSVDPLRGTLRGGTRVRLDGSGTAWDEAARVTFAGAAATGCEVLGAESIECRTPPGPAGLADVRVVDGSGSDRYADLARDAFEYYESADPVDGGLGGGPIDGQIDVTVLGGRSRWPIEGAFVMLGTDAATPHQGLTDALGQIVFEDEGLAGPQQVSAGTEGYESASFVDFDARDVTIFLEDQLPFHPEWPRGASWVRGELVFDGPDDSGPNPWAIVPDPIDADEHEECRVETTRAELLGTIPAPGPGGTVTEEDANPEGRGYMYSIRARTGAVAVWAVCGLANEKTGAFLPYALGVTRDVLVGPGESVEAVDVAIDIPLDHLVTAGLEDTPTRIEAWPNHYRMDLYLDLGPDGFLARHDRSVQSFDPGAEFRFAAQPALVGTIADARWALVGGAYPPEEGTSPLSVVLETGIADADEPFVLGGFVGAPVLRDPEPGGVVYEGRIAWDALDETPTFTEIVLQVQGRFPITRVWTIVARGDIHEVTLPDLSAIGGLPEPPEGPLITWIAGIRTDAIEFDDFSYAYLEQRYWDGWAADAFLLSLR